jgi:cystathionine gamma-synthase
MLYPNLETAQRCATYIRQQKPGNIDLIILQVEILKDRGSVSEVDYKVICEWLNIYAVAFPKSMYNVAKQFWQYFGEGISSREAQLCQKLFDAGEYIVTPYSKSSSESLHYCE